MIPVLPGDGIGPIVMAPAMRVLQAVGVELAVFPFGYACWQRCGESLPEETLAAIGAAGVGWVGAATTPDEGCPSPILELRRRLGLDLLVRPTAGITVVGLATGGMYAEPERAGPPAEVRRRLEAHQVERLLAESFARARRGVTAVDKPTVFRHSAALFRDAAARLKPDHLSFELVNADAFVARVLRDPGSVDVICAESFLADVLSDLTAALDGGIGRAPSASLGPDDVAIFEPVHGSAPRRVNDHPIRVDPTGALRSGLMMLEHIGRHEEASRVRHALDCVGEQAGRSTEAMGEAWLAALDR